MVINLAVKTVSSLEDAKADVYKKIKPKLEELMADIAVELEKNYESFISKWYSDGPIGRPGAPKYYDRTFDLYYGSSGYGNGIGDTGSFGGLGNSSLVTETDDGFYGEASIVVTSYFLHGYYKDPVDYVFNRSWASGIHGTIGTGGQTKPPKDMMDKWFKGFKSTIHRFIRSHGL